MVSLQQSELLQPDIGQTDGQPDLHIVQPTPEEYAGKYLHGEVLTLPNTERTEQTPEISLIETLWSLKQDFKQIRESLSQTRTAIRQLGDAALQIRSQMEETEQLPINESPTETEPALTQAPEPSAFIEWQPEEELFRTDRPPFVAEEDSDPDLIPKHIKDEPAQVEPAMQETSSAFDGYIYRAYFHDGFHAVKVVGGGERQGHEYVELVNWDDPGQTHPVLSDEFEAWNRRPDSYGPGIKARISRWRDKSLDKKDDLSQCRRRFVSRSYHGLANAAYTATEPYHRAKHRLGAKLRIGYRVHEGILKISDLEDAANGRLSRLFRRGRRRY